MDAIYKADTITFLYQMFWGSFKNYFIYNLLLNSLNVEKCIKIINIYVLNLLEILNVSQTILLIIFFFAVVVVRKYIPWYRLVWEKSKNGNLCPLVFTFLLSHIAHSISMRITVDIYVDGWALRCNICPKCLQLPLVSQSLFEPKCTPASSINFLWDWHGEVIHTKNSWWGNFGAAEYGLWKRPWKNSDRRCGMRMENMHF